MMERKRGEREKDGREKMSERMNQPTYEKLEWVNLSAGLSSAGLEGGFFPSFLVVQLSPTIVKYRSETTRTTSHQMSTSAMV